MGEFKKRIRERAENPELRMLPVIDRDDIDEAKQDFPEPSCVGCDYFIETGYDKTLECVHPDNPQENIKKFLEFCWICRYKKALENWFGDDGEASR